MSTDIAPSVTAEYTATVPVADDGEAFDHAAEVQALLPILNRIEYVKQLSGLGANAPNALALERDYIDTVADHALTESSALTFRSGFQFFKTDTGVNLYSTGGNNDTAIVIASGSSNNRGSLTESTYNVKTPDLDYMYVSLQAATWADCKLNFGLGDFTDLLLGSVAVYWRWTGSGSFEVHNRNASSTIVEGSIAPPVDAEAVLLGFRRSGSSIIASFNTTDVATFTPTNTVSNIKPCIMLGASSTSTATYWLRRYRRSFDYTPFGAV